MIVTRQNVEQYSWGTNCHGWHLVQSNKLSVIEELIPPGSEECMHFHNNAEQFFFVLSGTVTLEVNGETFTLKERDGIHVKTGSHHQVRNESCSDVVLLVTSTPPSHGDKVIP